MLHSDKIILIAELVGIALLIAGNLWLRIRRGGMQTRKSAELDQSRLRELDRQLVNPARDQEKGAGGKLRPYEEKYSSESKDTGTLVDGLRIELKVTSPTSELKYLTQIKDRITIGTDQSNDLVLNSQQAAPRQCELRCKGRHVFARSVDEQPAAIIERSHARRRLTDQPIRLRSQDRLSFGDITIEILFV